jgi:hypothetical protein
MSDWGDGWSTRLRSLFTWRRIWGPATMLLGLLQGLARVGWHSLDALGRLDVLWRVVESTNGGLAFIASIVSAWWFGLALIALGLLYTIFVGEPRAGVQRHPALPYLAASVFFVCLTLLAGLAIYGEIEFKLRQAYAAGQAGIPRGSSPSNPQTPSNQRPLYADAPRTLTPDQQRLLITEGAKVRSELGAVVIAFLGTDGESRSYANALQAALVRGAVNASVTLQSIMTDPNNEGVLIVVKDTSNPPPPALKLEQLLLIADIPSRFATDTYFNPDSYPVVLFVGPRPIQR